MIKRDGGLLAGTRRAKKAIGYGTTVAQIVATVAGSTQPMPLDEQLRSFAKVEAERRRGQVTEQLRSQTRIKNQPTTSLVLKELCTPKPARLRKP
jgi:hypothetical protein